LLDSERAIGVLITKTVRVSVRVSMRVKVRVRVMVRVRVGLGFEYGLARYN
jgi:hypothetical protein